MRFDNTILKCVGISFSANFELQGVLTAGPYVLYAIALICNVSFFIHVYFNYRKLFVYRAAKILSYLSSMLLLMYLALPMQTS